MESIVKFEHVCFFYTDQEIVHNVSFSVEENSFLGIVGPNGGGKTTLLRLLVGLEKPTHGNVTVLGTKPEIARKHIGYVMQHMNYDPLFPATVFDITLIGRAKKKIWGRYNAKDKEIAKQSLLRVGMEKYLNQSFSSLSGGQRQRVLIAQALCSEPRILVLDEPTSNIDIDGEKAVHNLLTSLAEHLTIISVSHNINTVLQCVSHVLCVNKTVAMNRLDSLHPDILKKAYGGDIAILHHELNCRIFNDTNNSCDAKSISTKRAFDG